MLSTIFMQFNISMNLEDYNFCNYPKLSEDHHIVIKQFDIYLD